MPASSNHNDGTPVSWPRRLGWLLLIWAASVVTLGVAAWMLRVVMRAVGMAA
jgi:hypothetical protein